MVILGMVYYWVYHINCRTVDIYPMSWETVLRSVVFHTAVVVTSPRIVYYYLICDVLLFSSTFRLLNKYSVEFSQKTACMGVVAITWILFVNDLQTRPFSCCRPLAGRAGFS